MHPNQHSSRLNGVVYTPADVADEVTRIALDGLCRDKIRVLEPSAGDGAFLKSLLASGVREENITAVDIDPKAAIQLRREFGNATVTENDFLSYSMGPEAFGFDLIVGNPPFIKRVAYNNEFRERLDELAACTGFPRAELKNAWAAFVVAASNLMNSDGVLALVVPYEMITVNYGGAVQAHLSKLGFDVEIYVPDQKAFPTIEQDAVVLVGRLSGGDGQDVRISRVAECSNLIPICSAIVSQTDSCRASIDKKSVLIDSDTTELLYKLREEMAIVSDYCSSAPGVVTAANRYFILREEETARRKLLPWARQIVKKGSYLPRGPVLSNSNVFDIARSEPCNLIDFCWDEGPELSREAEEYLEECESAGIASRYKCQRRKPWYRIPIVSAGDGVFFKRAHISRDFA